MIAGPGEPVFIGASKLYGSAGTVVHRNQRITYSFPQGSVERRSDGTAELTPGKTVRILLRDPGKVAVVFFDKEQGKYGLWSNADEDDTPQP